MELGDKSEDTRRGDGLDGQRLPPFCGPHGDSTPEPSWNQARALVSETHRRPSRRPFATHPTCTLLRAPSFPSALPSQDSDLSARRPIALIRALELASWWTRQGHICRHPRRGAGGRPNSHSQLCEPVTWTTGSWCAGRCSLVGRCPPGRRGHWCPWSVFPALVGVHQDDGELRPGPQGYTVSLPGEMPPPWSRLSCSASCPRSFSSSSATYCSRS